MWDTGLRIWGLGYRVGGRGFRFEVPECEIRGLGGRKCEAVQRRARILRSIDLCATHL